MHITDNKRYEPTYNISWEVYMYIKLISHYHDYHAHYRQQTLITNR